MHQHPVVLASSLCNLPFPSRSYTATCCYLLLLWEQTVVSNHTCFDVSGYHKITNLLWCSYNCCKSYLSFGLVFVDTEYYQGVMWYTCPSFLVLAFILAVGTQPLFIRIVLLG